MSLTVQEWIAEVDALRAADDLLARGAWHGYLDAVGGGPRRGRYYLVRWAQPTIAISSDDRDWLVEIARTIERSIAASE